MNDGGVARISARGVPKSLGNKGVASRGVQDSATSGFPGNAEDTAGHSMQHAAACPHTHAPQVDATPTSSYAHAHARPIPGPAKTGPAVPATPALAWWLITVGVQFKPCLWCIYIGLAHYTVLQ